MKFKQHLPSYVSGFDDDLEQADITCLHDVYSLNCVKKALTKTNSIGVFYGDNGPTQDLLMHLYKNNNGIVEWTVLGYIYGKGYELGLQDYEQHKI